MSEEKEKIVEEQSMDMGGIFDNEIEDTVAEVPSSSYSTADENIYSVSINHEKAVDKHYKSIGRFTPNPYNTKDVKLNVLAKYLYFLPHPENPESRLVVDCTSNYGERDNIITKAFFHCYNSNNPALKALGKRHFSRKSYWFTNYQIIKDVQQPDMEGKVKILRFANQVNEIIEDITTSDASIDKVAVNYSHPLKGRNFILDVREKSYKDEKSGQTKNMTSYESSKFQDKNTVIKVPKYNAETKDIVRNEDGSVVWIDKPELADMTKEYQMSVFEYLKDQSPNLEDYKAKPWTKEQEDEIVEAVRLTLDDPYVFAQIYKKMYKKAYVPSSGEAVETSQGGMAVDISGGLKEETVVEDAKATDETKQTTTQTTAEAEVYGKSDDLPDGMDDEFENIT